MDHLLQLSNVACQAERLEESLNRNPCHSSPTSSSSSSSSRQHSDESTNSSPPICDSMEAASSSSVQRQQQSAQKSAAETITINDRKIIRDKIKIAYKKKASTFEELLELCSHYAEDQVYDKAPTKLDYYKNGISCCKTIFELSDHMNAPVSVEKTASTTDNSGGGEEVPRGLKRAKTQH